MHHILSVQFNNPNLPVRPLPGFHDDFSGGGGGYLTLGNTNDGKPWQYPAPAAGPYGPGWFQRTDQSATGIDRSTLAIVDGVSSDGYLETHIQGLPTEAHTQQFGLAFRVSDANNYMIYAQQDTGDHVRLARVVNGTTYQIGNAMLAPRIGDTLGVEFEGEQITCFFNGEPVIQRTSDFNITETKHGLYSLVEDGSSPWFGYCNFIA